MTLRIYEPDIDTQRGAPRRSRRQPQRGGGAAWVHAAVVDVALAAVMLLGLATLAGCSAAASVGGRLLPHNCVYGQQLPQATAPGGDGCYIDPASGRQVCPLRRPQQQPQQAQQRQPRWPDPTIVMIDDGYTGTLVQIGDQRCFVLTCAHGLNSEGQRAKVTNRFGFCFSAECIALDAAGDVAILKIAVPAQYVATIAAGPPAVGTPLTITGFGGGSYNQKPLTAGYRLEGEPLNVGQGRPIPGDSGGPVRNPAGEVVGTLTGVKGDSGFYSQHTSIVAIIERVRSKLGLAANQPAPGPPSPAPPAPAASPPSVYSPPAVTPPVAPPDVPPLEVQPPAAVAPPVAAPPVAVQPPPAPSVYAPPTSALPSVAPPAALPPGPATTSWLDRIATGAIARGLVLVGLASGPAATVALLTWSLVKWRRNKKKRAGGTPARGQEADPSVVTFHTERAVAEPLPRDTTEGKQLLELGNLEGRNPLLDCIAGTITRSRLERDAANHDDPNVKQYAKDLVYEIDRQFNQIAPPKITVGAAA